jgi:SAM-dependent methyltransferase
MKHMISHTGMPEWLETYIYGTLAAQYNPQRASFMALNFTRDQLLAYLGTYFPRSYAEAFCIFTTLFDNERIAAAIRQRQELNILVLGAGTGGDCLGLLRAIKNKFPRHRQNVWLFDGNREAMAMCRNILDQFRVTEQPCLDQVTAKCCDFVVQGLPNESDEPQFDFILSSKVFSELVAQKLKNVYYDFAMQYLPKLAENGICLMLDVTQPFDTSQRNFAPKTMNEQTTRALHMLVQDGVGEFRTLLPALCREHETTCGNCDFVSYEFCSYRHPQRLYQGNRSQVVYRVLARENLARVARVNIATPRHNLGVAPPCGR